MFLVLNMSRDLFEALKKLRSRLNKKVEDMKLVNFIKLNNVSDVNRNVYKKVC